MKHVKHIVLKEDTVCRACSDHLKRGQRRIKYNNNKDKDFNGIYCDVGCLEGFIDYWLEGGRDEAIMESRLLRLREGIKRMGS